MGMVKYVYWREEDAWLGYLAEYPDDWTQGESLDDLIEHLDDLHRELTVGLVWGPGKATASEPGRRPGLSG